ncbi:PREDICTED: uncharacterized protein LOC104594907 [Nelumbo nucifera]|uniref:Uncharacterized protein LOC104594907 n=2 Tax=Nelumbo nucifera TaxID=4432 RepID=A0A1U7ZKQ9_NELNU|nr:PREDICTED: uncharacterized protein LOC104594907 [Nelumbo nucifera]DAD26231.1 TPA_asm: hypothetical protein HUJ06_027699 [Nelumbo nucifera]
MKTSCSSSSTSSFDGNLGNSHNATVGCLSTIVRRLLCFGGLPTHPADHLKEPDCIKLDHGPTSKETEEKSEVPTATPGIVARLMGLESLPAKTPDSIGRSRSANSAEYWPEFEKPQGRHRRVRTSLSFREASTFLQLENEDFLLLSFENVRETNELRCKGRKCETGFGELKQRKTEMSRNNNKENRKERIEEKKNKTNKEDKENRKRVHSEKEKPERRISDRRPLREVSNRCDIKDQGSTKLPQKKDAHTNQNALRKTGSPPKPTKHKDVSEKAKLAKKKKSNNNASSTKKVETECNSENSSPVSVLDLTSFLVDSETPLSEEESKPKGSTSRRKLSPELAKSEGPSPLFARITSLDDWESNSFDTKAIKETSKEDDQAHLEWWGEICHLTDQDIKTSSWVSREVSTLEEFDEIRIEFSVQILDQLLHEIIDEFAIFPSTNLLYNCV